MNIQFYLEMFLISSTNQKAPKISIIFILNTDSWHGVQMPRSLSPHSRMFIIILFWLLPLRCHHSGFSTFSPVLFIILCQLFYYTLHPGFEVLCMSGSYNLFKNSFLFPVFHPILLLPVCIGELHDLGLITMNWLTK